MRIKNILTQASVVTLTLDVWKSNAEWRAIGIRGQFLPRDGVPQARVICLKHFDHPRETSEDVANDVLEVVLDMGISPTAICSDSATVMTAGMGKFNAGMEERDQKTSHHVVCICHQIDLVLKALNKNRAMRNFREDLKKVVSIFNNIRVRRDLDAKGSAKKALRGLLDIRWSTLCYTTGDLIELSPLLQEYIEEHPDEEEARGLANANIDLIAVTELATLIFPILEKFHQIQVFFEGGRPAKVASYLQAMHELKLVLQNAPEEFAEAAQLGIDKIDALRSKHWHHQGLVLTEAGLLDPNVRVGIGNYISLIERRTAEQAIRNEVTLLASQEPAPIEQQRPALGTWESTTQVEGKAQLKAVATPIRDLDPAEEYNEFVQDPWKLVSIEQFFASGAIYYWNVSGARWRFLSKVALKVLMTPASSADIESFFSTVGWFDDIRRSSILPSHLEMVAILKANWDIAIEEIDAAVEKRFI
jgi:hypothetical protein